MDTYSFLTKCLCSLIALFGVSAGLKCKKPDGPCKCGTDKGVIDITPLNSDNAKYFIYGSDGSQFNYNPCSDYYDNYNCFDNTMVCAYDQNSFTWSIAGTSSSATWASSSDGSGDLAITVTQTDTSGTERSTEITYHCDETQDGTATAGASSGNNYKIVLTTKYACPVGGAVGGGGLSVGSILCILLVVLVFCYLVAGMAFMYAVKGARGVEMVPNITFWKDVGVLAKDGTVYAFEKVKSGVPSSGSKSEYESFS